MVSVIDEQSWPISTACCPTEYRTHEKLNPKTENQFKWVLCVFLKKCQEWLSHETLKNILKSYCSPSSPAVHHQAPRCPQYSPHLTPLFCFLCIFPSFSFLVSKNALWQFRPPLVFSIFIFFLFFSQIYSFLPRMDFAPRPFPLIIDPESFNSHWVIC